MIIDTHAHLTDDRYSNNLCEIISDLENNDIQKVFTVAYDTETIISSIKLAEKYSQVYAIIGIHPENAKEFNEDTIALIREFAHHPKVIGIGEIGLDYHYNNYDKTLQEKVFVEQIKLAHELKLPICIHNRDSIGDMLRILSEHKNYLEHGGVFHCFSESVEVYKQIKKLGLKIAFGGTLTFKNSRQAPEVCKIADINDILLETDSPYLTPHPYRGVVNEPKYTRLVGEKVAIIKGVSYNKISEITTQNTLEVYKKAR